MIGLDCTTAPDCAMGRDCAMGGDGDSDCVIGADRAIGPDCTTGPDCATESDSGIVWFVAEKLLHPANVAVINVKTSQVVSRKSIDPTVKR